MSDIYVGPYVKVPKQGDKTVFRMVCPNENCEGRFGHGTQGMSFCSRCGAQLKAGDVDCVLPIFHDMHEFFENYFNYEGEYAVSYHTNAMYIISNFAGKGGVWYSQGVEFAIDDLKREQQPHDIAYWGDLMVALTEEGIEFTGHYGVLSICLNR